MLIFKIIVLAFLLSIVQLKICNMYAKIMNYEEVPQLGKQDFLTSIQLLEEEE